MHAALKLSAMRLEHVVDLSLAVKRADFVQQLHGLIHFMLQAVAQGREV